MERISQIDMDLGFKGFKIMAESLKLVTAGCSRYGAPKSEYVRIFIISCFLYLFNVSYLFPEKFVGFFGKSK